MSSDKHPYIGVGTVMHYGGAPVDLPFPEIPRVQPTQDVPVALTTLKRKVTVAARVDEKGQLWLRLTVDGVHVAEVQSDATTLTLTEEI